ncbi:MAG: hypothetical protein IJ060_00755 [Oscillospiraceae bacterium]|nr:hypothetical protein [Oscillospiraceae bacterium]
MAIHFHIPDFSRNFHLNMLLIKLMKEYPQMFREGADIGSVYGEFPSSLWNGGRVLGGMFPENEIRYVAEQLNENGVSLRYTFTNPLINQSHLDDRHCNRCLELTQRYDRMNGVIVVSPVLEKYIRQKYPHYKIISSTCKQITDFEALCEELEKDYDYVVLDYNFNNNFELLEKLPHKEKVEILVNAVCTPNCPRRKAHYQYLGRTQIAYCEHLKKKGPGAPWKPAESFKCEHIGNTVYDAAHFPTHITPDAIFGKYAEMGFENFKIEGRSSTLFNNMETYLYYLAKPEYRDSLRLTYLLSLEASGIVTVND